MATTASTSMPLNPVWRLLGGLSVLLLFCFTANVFAAQVKMAWNPVSGASGYRVHYGTASGNYNAAGSPLNVVGSTTTSVTIPDSTTYYFAVKGYSSAQESGYSNEVNNPIAQFGANTTSGLTVQFADQSTGTVNGWCWKFSANSSTCDSPDRNPSKTYSTAGTYTVSLVVTGLGGVTSPATTKTITVNAPSTTAPPVPSFTYTTNSTTGQVPLAVNFTGSWTGSATSQTWDFGDGSAKVSTSSTTSPVKVTKNYNTPGSYTVSFTVAGPGGAKPQSRRLRRLPRPQQPISARVRRPSLRGRRCNLPIPRPRRPPSPDGAGNSTWLPTAAHATAPLKNHRMPTPARVPTP